FDPSPLALRLVREHALVVCARPERDHVPVLEEEERVGDASLAPGPHRVRLDLEAVRVPDRAEPADLQRPLRARGHENTRRAARPSNAEAPGAVRLRGRGPIGETLMVARPRGSPPGPPCGAPGRAPSPHRR